MPHSSKRKSEIFAATNINKLDMNLKRPSLYMDSRKQEANKIIQKCTYIASLVAAASSSRITPFSSL